MSIDNHTIDIVLEPGQDAAGSSAVGPGTSSQTHQSSLEAKRRWALPVLLCRVLARLLDMAWQSALVVWCVNLAFPLSSLSILTQLLFVAFCVLPLTLLIDFVVQATFSNTPGKKLLGIRVVTWRGGKLSVDDAFTRNFMLWRFGFVCGFVPLVPFGMLGQWLRLTRGNRTYYDDQLHLRIAQSDRPVIVNIGLGLVASLVLILFGVYIDAVQTERHPVTKLVASWLPGYSQDSASLPAVALTELKSESLDAEPTEPLEKELPERTVKKESEQKENEQKENEQKENEAQTRSLNIADTLEPEILDSASELEASKPSVVAQEDKTTEPIQRRWWTNFDTGFTVEIEEVWQFESSNTESGPEFRFQDTDTTVKLEPVAGLNGGLAAVADNFLSGRPEFGAESVRVPFDQGSHLGLRLIPYSSAGTKTDIIIEWLQVGEKFHRLSIQNVSDEAADSVEILRRSLWRTFP